jgi:hypothetical protein
MGIESVRLGMRAALADTPRESLPTTPVVRHRVLHGFLIALAVVLGLAILIRLVLDPIATYETRKALHSLEGFDGALAGAHVTVVPPGYTVTHLKVVERPAEESNPASARAPLLYVDRAEVRVSGRELLRGHLVASLRVERPKINLPPAAKRPAAKEAARAPDLSAQLAQVPPLRVSRVEVLDGQLLFRANEGHERPRLWIHKLDLTAQNLGTRRQESQGRPVTVSAHGTVAHSGDLTLFVSADPLARPWSFAGEASLRGLRASDLYAFLAAKTDLQASQGTVEIFATFESRDGAINGDVKPVLKNIELSSAQAGLWPRTKAWLADKAVELNSDRVPGRNAVATTIPIRGKFSDPEIQFVPAVLGVVRNAFVAGLESGFANLPPPSADEKQNLWSQTKEAVQKNAGPPKAQPSKDEKSR